MYLRWPMISCSYLNIKRSSVRDHSSHIFLDEKPFQQVLIFFPFDRDNPIMGWLPIRKQTSMRYKFYCQIVWLYSLDVFLSSKMLRSPIRRKMYPPALVRRTLTFRNFQAICTKMAFSVNNFAPKPWHH